MAVSYHLVKRIPDTACSSLARALEITQVMDTHKLNRSIKQTSSSYCYANKLLLRAQCPDQSTLVSLEPPLTTTVLHTACAAPFCAARMVTAATLSNIVYDDVSFILLN